ncbi:EamA family transporter [Candidatus Desulfarcum epimagneticum]|uniref:EamA family transporter n=1 Tax=uncultured Desulfobacteraceae bacterium TaxID=218296 RepID=A0A484HJU1_9BACT|nr:EamA family transporter [uncultured Desulfobacteraceae bacterium]
MSVSKRGYLYVIAAAFLWASSGSAAKFLFNQGMSPFELVQLRLTISSACLFVWLAARRPALLRIEKKDIFYFAVLGTVGMAAVQFFYLFAISRIHVAPAILLEYLAPVFIAIYMTVFAGERIDTLTLLAILGSFAGVLLVSGVWGSDVSAMKISGVIAGVCAGLAFAWYSIHGEYGMRRYPPWTVLFYALATAAVVWNVICFPLESFFQVRSPAQWGVVLYIGVLGTLTAFALYFKGVNLIRASRAGAAATLEPIVAGILSWMFLNEAPTPAQIAGGALVIGSVAALVLKKVHDDRTPEAIRSRGMER